MPNSPPNSLSWRERCRSPRRADDAQRLAGRLLDDQRTRVVTIEGGQGISIIVDDPQHASAGFGDQLLRRQGADHLVKGYTIHEQRLREKTAKLREMRQTVS